MVRRNVVKIDDSWIELFRRLRCPFSRRDGRNATAPQGNGGDQTLAYLRFHMKLHLDTLASFARDGPRMRCVSFVDISENEESSGKFVEASGEEPVSATAGGRAGLDRQDPEIAIQQPYVTRLHLQIRRRHPTPDRQNVYFVAMRLR
jgi:hypothetical protein